MRLFILIAGITMLILTPALSQNLIKNPGMEQSNTKTTHWRLDQFTANGSTAKVETGISHSGNNSISVENLEKNDARLVQDVTVKPNTTYKISGWIRSENISTEGIGANLSFDDHWFTSEEIEGTSDEWRHVEFYLVVEEAITTMSLCLRVGGYGGISTGKAYFDDIIMEEVKNAPGGSRVFTVGSTKDKNKQNRNNTINTSRRNEQDNFQQEEIPMDPATLRSIIIVYSLIGLSVVIFCLQLILVKEN